MAGHVNLVPNTTNSGGDTNMIIIEGPDLVGKTTLAKKIAERAKLRYRHLSRMPDVFDFFHGYTQMMHPHVVHDRMFLSEPVYATARGDQTPLTPERFHYVQGYAQTIGCITISVMTSLEAIEKRYREREAEEMYNWETMVRVHATWMELLYPSMSNPLWKYHPHIDYRVMLGDDEFVNDELIHNVISSHDEVLQQIYGTTEFQERSAIVSAIWNVCHQNKLRVDHHQVSDILHIMKKLPWFRWEYQEIVLLVSRDEIFPSNFIQVLLHYLVPGSVPNYS